MRHSFLIWLTLGLSSLGLLVSSFTLFRMLWAWTSMMHVSQYFSHGMTLEFWQTLFYAAVVYAVIRRPAWGHALCIVFAVLLTLVFAISAKHPHTYGFALMPSMQLKFVHALVFLASLIYAFMMAIGSKSVRHYFSPPLDDSVDAAEHEPASYQATNARRAAPAPAQEITTPLALRTKVETEEVNRTKAEGPPAD
jgi:hypothetical protein